jgi:predicted RNA-binding protein with TRAM domain
MQPAEILKIGQHIDGIVDGIAKQGDPFVHYEKVVVIIKDSIPALGEKVTVEITAVKERVAFGKVIAKWGDR